LYGDRDEVLEGEFVRLMTIHGAKGLEFDTVFLIGMNDGIFPNRNAVIESKDGLTEERRLAYVAITRAMHRLFVSSNAGFNYVLSQRNKPSRFMREMDHERAVHDVGGIIQEKSPQDMAFKQYKKKDKLRIKPADVVVHDDFGEGIVLSLDEDKVKVAFNYPFGTKIIMQDFAGLRLKGDLT
ncbi:MAG TPA: ATP-dependent helicase, partial [Erysipelothrix sp.]|nr:ATP-dependent helicase [Erysipelothrix sp.]